MQRCLGCMEEYENEYEMCPFCGYEVGTPPKEAYHMVPGSRLSGRYLIGKVLGYGGFGVTYIAYDEVIARKVAIKEYLPGEFSTRLPGQTRITTYEGEREEQFSNGLKKFVDEAKMLAQMHETNGVVQIFNSFEENATAYIVMEYLEGKNLKEFLEEHGKLSVENAKSILHPIIIALKDVHAKGIVHRDIAPDNIFLANDGRVKLLDFGASRFATTSHSKSLSVIIKAGYAPVEQYRSRGEQGPWTDVYSLAATFYKMITGITPEDSMERVEKDELQKPSKVGTEISKNTENALMNALNIRYQDRTESMEMFESQLFSESKVKSSVVRLKKSDVGKWPLWVKMTAMTAMVVVVVFGSLLATGVISFDRFVPKNFMLKEDQARVPNVVNEMQNEAESLLSNAELRMLIVDKQNSEYIPEGLVVSQGIGKGKIVSKNDIVEVVISAGREKIYMPDIVGYPLEEATRLLSFYGIVVNASEAYSTLEAGSIVSADLEEGEVTYRGETVNIVVSKGPNIFIDTEIELEIPDLCGKTFEESKKILAELGLSLKKGDYVLGGGKNGTVAKQQPLAGTKCHQGDTVTLSLYAEETPKYVPDVQYKDEGAAIDALRAVGLNVTVEYAENASVAKGKVISQSQTAGSTVDNKNNNIAIVVSLGTKEVNEIVSSWSEWITELPAGVSKSGYVIEEKTQYCFRDKSTTTSTQPNLEGWIQYDSETNKGEYGSWSAWSTEVPASGSDREINTKTQYSYSDYETTSQVDNNVLAGWNLYDTEITYGEYGEWSDWSTVEPAEESTREIRTKTQYSYSDYETASQIDNSSKEGWTLESEKTTSAYEDDWGAWSEWSENDVTASDSRKVEEKTQYQHKEKETKISLSAEEGWDVISKEHRWNDWSDWSDWTDEAISSDDYTNVETQTLYYYFYWRCPNCGGHCGWFNTRDNVAGKCAAYGGSCNFGGAIPNENFTSFWDPVAPSFTYSNYWTADSRPTSDSTSQGRAYSDGGTKTQYRKQTRTDYYEYKLERWSDWSTWTDTVFTPHDNTQMVNERTVYRYSDRPLHYTYYFSRWTTPTAYSDQVVSESSTRKVTTKTLYSYRNKGTYTTYYFSRWTTPTAYSDVVVSENTTRKVTTRDLYQFRDRSKNTTYFFYQWGKWSDYRDEKVDKSSTREVQTRKLYRYKAK